MRPGSPMGPKVPEVSVQQARERLAQHGSDAVLIDVREPDEYTPRRAEGAVSIPLSQFVARVGEIPRDRDVLLICEHGSRSLQAATYLHRQGFERVSNVTGGTDAWEREKLPMEHGK